MKEKQSANLRQFDEQSNYITAQEFICMMNEGLSPQQIHQKIERLQYEYMPLEDVLEFFNFYKKGGTQ